MKRNYCRDTFFFFFFPPPASLSFSISHSHLLVRPVCPIVSLPHLEMTKENEAAGFPMRCHALNWHLLSSYGATVPLSKKLVFFIGWLVTLLRLLMSKRLRSASSRFNLTEWKVGIYLITAAQALLSAVSLPRCLDPQGSLVFDSREGRLKCSRSAPFWLAPDSLSFFLPIQYPLRSLSVTFSLFLFLSLSPPFLYICLFLGFSFVENWMTPPLPEPG